MAGRRTFVYNSSGTLKIANGANKVSEGVRNGIRNEVPVGEAAFHEDRIMRITVYKHYLPLKNLFSKSLKDINRMATHILDALDGLYTRAKILHRDLSHNSIMYEMREDGPWFVLIDFDLATVLNEDGIPEVPTSTYRTGTLPFLAIELLQDMYRSQREDEHVPIPHRLRYDFESLYLVSLYCALTMPGPTNSHQAGKIAATVLEWESGSYKDLAATRIQLLTDTDTLTNLPFPPIAELLQFWFIASWQKVFGEVHLARRNHKTSQISQTLHALLGLPSTKTPDFDWETANGTISRAILVNELTQSWEIIKNHVQ